MRMLEYLTPVGATIEPARIFERMLTALDPADLAAVAGRLRSLDVPVLLVWGTAEEAFGLEWAYRLLRGPREGPAAGEQEPAAGRPGLQGPQHDRPGVLDVLREQPPPFGVRPGKDVLVGAVALHTSPAGREAGTTAAWIASWLR